MGDFALKNLHFSIYTLLLAALLAVAGSGRSVAAPATATTDSVEAVWAAAAPVLPETPILADYFEVAVWHSPTLRAAYHDWEAALAAAGYVGAPPDPVIGYMYFVDPVETRTGPQNHRFSLRQRLPWFGTLGARKDREAQAALAAERRFISKQLQLFYKVEAAYADYYYLGQEIALTSENLELLRFWESVARGKYRVALKQHPDMIKAQVELGRMEDRLLTLQNQTQPASARLRSAVGMTEAVSLPVPQTLEVTETHVDRDAVLASALDANPDLQALVHTIEGTRAGVRAAGKTQWPGLVLGVDYIATGPAVIPNQPDSGKDAFMVSVGVSVPLWFSANGARKREAEAMQRSAEHAYTDARIRLTALVEQSVFEHEDALRKLRLYRDGLVPKAQQSLNASYTAYQSGDADFLNVLDAQRQLLEFQLLLERSRSNLATTRAALDMIAPQRNGQRN
jgi:outer membrane protein TolC